MKRTIFSLPNYNDIKIHKYNCYQITKCISSNTIQRTNNITYLDIFIDQYLKWNTHINFINNKIRNTIYKFKQLKSLITINILKLVHNSLVDSIWYIYLWTTYNNHIHQLIITHKLILTFILGKKKRCSTD